MRWGKKPRHQAYLLGIVILDLCPMCSKDVEPYQRQRVVYWPENKSFGRVCGACLDQEREVMRCGPSRIS